MSSLKQLKLAEKIAADQKALITELQLVGKDIERCEKLISGLKAELDSINSRFQGPRSTREDIAYLTELLACAKKSSLGKSSWEVCKSEHP